MTMKILTTAGLLSSNIEAILTRLRETPDLPAVLLDMAEKIYRLYKLNKLDHDLQDLRETTANTLQELERLAARAGAGDVRLAELESLAARHERTIADLTARLTPAQTGR